jgi:hypothetical protein
VDGDRVLVVVLVEAHVGEELARAVVAEGGVAERVAGLGARAGLDLVGVDGDRARRDPRRAGDHPLPAVLDRLDATVPEPQMGLVVHAVQALDDRLLQLVDHLTTLARLRVDLVDALVVHLHLEVGRPAAVAAQPGPGLDGRFHPPQHRLQGTDRRAQVPRTRDRRRVRTAARIAKSSAVLRGRAGPLRTLPSWYIVVR